MQKHAGLIVLCALLAGCSDPLSGVGRLKDLQLSADEPSATALPTEEEVAREGYFGTAAAAGETGSLSVAAPEADSTPKEGLLGALRRRLSVDKEADAVAKAVALSEGQVAEQQTSVTPEIQEVDPQDTQSAAVEPDAATARPRAGLLGRLLGRNDDSTSSAPSVSQNGSDQPDPEEVQLAALEPELGEQATEDLKPEGWGLFGRKSRAAPREKPRSGPDAQDVAYGTLLPFGEVARSCAARGQSLGRKVERAPGGGYTLFDTKPDTATPRTFYITGFKDGCPRQLTAANVLFGSASLYEQLHYGPGGEHLPRAATDKAYEKVKSLTCGVSRRKPCGGKIGKMDRTTVFVTAYDRFGNASSWSELLVHNGEILASALKTNK